MSTSLSSTNAFIGSIERPVTDSYLAQQGFGRGLILFALPDYGVVFKCLAEGRLIDLEFGAFFALLKFAETSLAGEKIKHLKILSSNPEFVFAFTGRSSHLIAGSARERLLKEHAAKLKFDVAYIEPWLNQTRFSPAEFPSLPAGKEVKIITNLTRPGAVGFKPIQKGIKV